MRLTRLYVLPLMLGVLSTLGLMPPHYAIAQEPVGPWVPPDVESVIAGGLLASLLIGVVMAFLRASPLRRWLAPEPGTEMSRLLNLGLVALLGVGCGAVHLGPQIAPGTPGWLLGGLISGGLAAFGRDIIVSGTRVATTKQVP